MASPRPRRRTDRPGSEGRSSDRPTRRRRAARDSGRDTWPRRIGIALGLVLVGGTIVLAGSGALDPAEDAALTPAPSRLADTSPGATSSVLPSSPLPAPSLEGAATAVTREREWQITASIPSGIPDRRRSMLLVYRGDAVVAETALGREDEQVIGDIPLRRGENRLSVAIRGPSGEGPRSATIIVTRDDIAPAIRVLDPASGAEVNAERVSVSGETEAGAQLTLSNTTTERSAPASVSADGSFLGEIGLAPGTNELGLRATDAAGNVATAQLTVIRGEGVAEARLTLSKTDFSVRQLPDSISLRVLVVDAQGKTVDGAEVVFSLSPPGLPTTTYRTVTTRGDASWLDVTMPRDGATAGEGFATARVTLADGSLVDVLTLFRFR